MDIFHKITKWLDHNRYVAMGALMVALVCLVSFGCESTTRWQVNSETREVTRPELEQQLTAAATDLDQQQAALIAKRDALIASGEIALADLDHKDERKAAALTAIGNIVQSAATGGFDPVSAGLGLFTLATTFIGGGALMDNRRKNSVIDKMKAERTANSLQSGA